MSAQFAALAQRPTVLPLIEAFAKLTQREREQCNGLSTLRGVLSHFIVDKPLPVPEKPSYFVQILDI